MDKYAARRQNLLALRDEYETWAKLSKLIETDPNYLSQLCGGKNRRNVGNELAQRIEQALGKPEGWMDLTPEERLRLAFSDDAAELALGFDSMDESEREAVRSVFRAFDRRRGKTG